MNRSIFALILIITIASPFRGFSQEEIQWKKNRFSGVYSSAFSIDSIPSNSVLMVDGKEKDALFIYNELIKYWTYSEQYEVRVEELRKYSDDGKLVLTFRSNKSNLIKPPIRIGRKKETEQGIIPFDTREVASIYKRKSTQRVILLFSFLLLIAILKFLFPIYFKVLINPLRTEVSFTLVSNFRNGAIAISALISSAIFSYFISMALPADLKWSMLVPFFVISVFYLIKYLAVIFFGYLFEKKDLIISLYFDWLINMVRMSVFLLFTALIVLFLSIDIAFHLDVIAAMLVLIPTVSVTTMLFKNVKSLTINYLFFYLCALEITPIIILIKVL